MTVEPNQMTAFRWDILWVLLGGDDYGLGLKRSLSDYRGEEVNHGRLYPNLDWLVEHGLVQKSELDKRTNEYELTDDGRDLLEARYCFIDANVSQEHVVEHKSRGDVRLTPRGAASGMGD